MTSQENKCDRHDSELTFYCENHDNPCCTECKSEHHDKCKLRDFKDFVSNIRSSYLLTRVESYLDEMKESCKRILSDREENAKSLDQQKANIEKEIRDARNFMIRKIEEYQNNILKELDAKVEKEGKDTRTIIDSMESIDNNLSKFKNRLLYLSNTGTDLELFLAIKQVETGLNEHFNYISSLSEGGQLDKIKVEWNKDAFDSKISQLLKQMEGLNIERQPCEIIINTKTSIQSQINIPPETNPLSAIKLTHFDTVQPEKTWAGFYRLLPDDKFVFVDCNEKTINIIKKIDTMKYKYVFTAGLAAPQILDVLFCEEDNTIYISTGCVGKNILRVDIKRHKMKSPIDINDAVGGIAMHGKSIVFCTRGAIKMIKLDDRSVKDVLTGAYDFEHYLSILKDRLYYTHWYENTVTCCELKDETCTKLWTFKNENVLRQPSCIAVDNENTIYVTGKASSNCVIISSDGRHHLEFATGIGNKITPIPIFFDKLRNVLVFITNGTIYALRVEK